jgi:lipoprotein
MKRNYLICVLIVVVSLPFSLCGCDDLGLKEIFSTFLVINIDKDSDVKLFCKSEKLKILSLRECEKVTDEDILDWARNNELISDENFNIFDIPSYMQIDSSKNVSIYLEAYVDGEKYTGGLHIGALQTNGYKLNKENVVLKSENGKKLISIFTYNFHVTI